MTPSALDARGSVRVWRACVRERVVHAWAQAHLRVCMDVCAEDQNK